MTVQDRLFLRKHGAIERKYAKLFNRVLAGQYRQLANLFINGRDLNEVDIEPLQKLYTRMYLEVMRNEGYSTWMQYVFPLTGERIGKKDITDMIAEDMAPNDPKQMQGFWQNLMTTYLNIYIVQRVTEVIGSTIKKVRETIQRQRNNGLTDAEIARMIKADARVQEIRANTIARTEATNAISKSQIFALESSGRKWDKSWHAIRDLVTRDAHYATDPKLWIPIKENFIIGGYQMAYPGDSTNGSPVSNFINCRCWLKYRVNNSNFGFNPVNR